MNMGNSQLWRPAANLIPLGTQNPSGIRILEGREGWTGGSGPYSAWQCPSQNPSGITDLWGEHFQNDFWGCPQIEINGFLRVILPKDAALPAPRVWI